MNDIRENIKGIFTPLVEMGEKDYTALIDEIGDRLGDARDAKMPLSDYATTDEIVRWKREVLDDGTSFAADLKYPRLNFNNAQDIAEVLNLLGLYEFAEAKEGKKTVLHELSDDEVAKTFPPPLPDPPSNIEDARFGSEESFKNPEGYGIYFASGYIEIYKDGKIVTQFSPDDVVVDEEE